MEDRGYFFIDGSCLVNHIYRLWQSDETFKDKPLDIGVLSDKLMEKWGRNLGVTVRLNFYFRKRDPRIKTHLKIPKSNTPGAKEHWEIIECAERNPQFTRELREFIDKAPEKFRDYFLRSEKGLDMRLACDALTLVANGKATNVVLYLNDRDYIPLIQSLKGLGVNVYLTCLTQKNPIQEKLCDICDRFLTLDEWLEEIFGVPREVEKMTEKTR